MHMRMHLDNIYASQLVRMHTGHYYKIKEVIGWDLPAARILVNYVEDKYGWVDTSESTLREA